MLRLPKSWLYVAGNLLDTAESCNLLVLQGDVFSEAAFALIHDIQVYVFFPVNPSQFMLYFCVQTSCDCFLLSDAHAMLLYVFNFCSYLVMASAKCETSFCQAAVCHECVS